MSANEKKESNQGTGFTIDPTILSAVSLVFEKAINQALQYDPGTKNALRSLGPLTIQIETSEPKFYLIIRIDEASEINVSLLQVNAVENKEQSSHSENADITLTGTFSDFVSLAFSKDHMLAKHNISVSGKIHQLSQLQEIANNVDIDWEEPIVALLGVVPGHFISERIRAAGRWTKHQKNEIKHWLPETLQEELRLVPSRHEVEHFFNDIDTLNALTQRIEARVNRLKQKLAYT